MLIDDDRDILTTLERDLEHSGFKVHAHSDPISALEHIEGGCKECELAVCDVSMPNMSGFQLARRMRGLRPDMKMILMTAFEVNKSEFDKVFPSTEIASVIRKPFIPSRLVDKIKEVYATN